MRKHISRKEVIFDEDVSGAMLPNGRGVSRGISRSGMPLLFVWNHGSTSASDSKIGRNTRRATSFPICATWILETPPLGFVMVKWAGIELARGRIEVLLGKNRSLLWFYPEFTTLYHKIGKNDPLFETDQISRAFLL